MLALAFEKTFFWKFILAGGNEIDRPWPKIERGIASYDCFCQINLNVLCFALPERHLQFLAH